MSNKEILIHTNPKEIDARTYQNFCDLGVLPAQINHISEIITSYRGAYSMPETRLNWLLKRPYFVENNGVTVPQYQQVEPKKVGGDCKDIAFAAHVELTRDAYMVRPASNGTEVMFAEGNEFWKFRSPARHFFLLLAERAGPNSIFLSNAIVLDPSLQRICSLDSSGYQVSAIYDESSSNPHYSSIKEITEVHADAEREKINYTLPRAENRVIIGLDQERNIMLEMFFAQIEGEMTAGIAVDSDRQSQTTIYIPGAGVRDNLDELPHLNRRQKNRIRKLTEKLRNMHFIDKRNQ